MSEYLLGHEELEWARLADQHALWRGTMAEALDRLGVSAGASVLEVGCGPGDLLADLAARVGPTGRARGLERDPRAVARAGHKLSGISWVDVQEGDLMTAEPGGPWDAIVARWVFSFLPDPGAAVRRLAAALRSGGVLVIQDYIHDPTRLYPEHPAFTETIEAFRAAYRARGGDLWVAGRLPGLMVAAGLEIAEVTPSSFAGGPGSAPMEWVGRFLHEHIDGVVAGGFLTPAQAAAFRVLWAERMGDPGAALFTPIVAVVAGRAGGG